MRSISALLSHILVKLTIKPGQSDAVGTEKIGRMAVGGCKGVGRDRGDRGSADN